jgi:hypothetical protein
MRAIDADVRQIFLRTASELNPIIGLSRRPMATPLAPPTMNDVEAFQKGTRKFNLDDYTSYYCYWFLSAAKTKQRELFLGNGGTTTIFVKSDENPTLPKISLPTKIRQSPIFQPLFEHFDFDDLQQTSAALTNTFLSTSKRLFGIGLEQEPQFKGVLFILPALSTEDFFAQPEEESKKWFELFDVYINESPSDKGLVLAAKTDLRRLLLEILNSMREEGLEYPER